MAARRKPAPARKVASRVVRVAAIQAQPILLDLERCTAKAIDLLGQAAARGARLVAFGETWLPGYPAWLDLCPGAAYWNHPPAKKAFARLMANSVRIPGPEINRIARAARRHGVVVVLGVHERVEGGPGHNTLFNTQMVIGSDGTILSRHRKLMPTFSERLVWGQGDGSGLDAVATPIGRVGHLICWEHWMPLARQAVHRSGEQIHVATWPSVHEMHQIASRHYAFEGRCFVLSVGQIIRARDLPKEMELPENLRGRPDELVYRGGTSIYGPDGGVIVPPVWDREEIVVADLDLSRIAEEAMALDVTGHYDRPDVFEFRVRS
jgi:nitrilase